MNFDVNVLPASGNDGLTAQDLLVENITAAPDVPLPAITHLDYSGAPNSRATFTFRDQNGVRVLLSNGNYHASISREDVHNDGDEMASDVLWDNDPPQRFFIVNGDLDHDRSVNVIDLGILATNWNMPGTWTWADGDLNYDGMVDVIDLGILATNWQAYLPESPQSYDELTVANLGSSNSLQLNWGTEGAPADATQWRIQRSTDGQTFTIYDHVPINVLSYPDENGGTGGNGGNGLTEGQRYWYRVRAVGGTHETIYTPKRGGTTQLPRPINPVAEALSSTSIKITWTDHSANESEFRVYRSPDAPGAGTLVGTVASGSATQFTDTNLDPGRTYYYYVTAKNLWTESGPSNFVNARTYDATLSAAAVSAESVALSWTSIAGAVSYEAWVSFDGTAYGQSAPLEGTDTYATVEGLDWGMTVYHKIEGLDASGNTIGFTNPAEATTLASEEIQAYESPNGPVDGAPVTPLLVAWYGLDTLNTLSQGDWRVESISDALGGTVNPRDWDSDGCGEPYKFNAGRKAITDLLAKIDGANGNPRDNIITQAEVDAVSIRMLAYSWGAITAVNESRKLAGTGSTLYGYHLNVSVPVDSLVVLDPIHNGPARLIRWVWFDGVLSNVRKFVNYYQTKGSEGLIHWGDLPWDLSSTDVYYNWFVGLLKGTTLPSTIANTHYYNITTDSGWASRSVTRVYRKDVRDPLYFMYYGQNYGRDNNHLTLPWYLSGIAILDLDPSYPADMSHPLESFLVPTAQ